MSKQKAQAPISDYAFISNCHSSALISKEGSIDWCCMPTFASSSCFAKILDANNGGHYSLTVEDGQVVQWTYLKGTLILRRLYHAARGECIVHEFFVMTEENVWEPRQLLIRLIECTKGHVSVALQISPRFEYGLLTPWFAKTSSHAFSAVGGSDALIIQSDRELHFSEDYSLMASAQLHDKEAMFVSVEHIAPQRLDSGTPPATLLKDAVAWLSQTEQWWRNWSESFDYQGADTDSVLTSALVLKGMCYGPSGALIAAPTTSLPESPGGSLNWDYRYSWIRDSVFSVRALSATNFIHEADRFRKFIQRSAAGRANSLQIMYGIDGKCRLNEWELEHLGGYGGARPVRVGNAAFTQQQLDCYGTLLQLIWHWHERGSSPDDDTWRFLVNLVNWVCEIWQEPGHSFWEFRTPPREYVYAKVMCWAAVNYGIKLSEDCLRTAPIRRWRSERKKIAQAIHEKGVDKKTNCFRESFGSDEVDGSLLLIPHSEFLDWKDPIMTATCNAVIARLNQNGLIRRYKGSPMHEPEGTFVACTFWLAECLAKQGRKTEAKTYFENASNCCNDLGLYSEEFSAEHQVMLGNFPQALSHLSHINAALALVAGG
jgi:GH15 family glucan-1,4-alpha-glucosidase